MVWKKTEAEPPRVSPTPSVRRPPAQPREEVATIGPSISIKGDLSGEEDLRIQGRVEGEITLRQNSITIGHEGKIRADIHGRSIRVEGQVHGNLYGAEDVVIRQSGTVHGNIVAPRVTLENGSKFKGSIDMEPGANSSAGAAPTEPVAKKRDSRPDQAAADAARTPAAANSASVPPKAAQAGLQLDKSAART